MIPLPVAHKSSSSNLIVADIERPISAPKIGRIFISKTENEKQSNMCITRPVGAKNGVVV
jgi:hypothetical protein